MSDKTYLVYLDNVCMDELPTSKKAIHEAQTFIRTQQGKKAEVMRVDFENDNSQTIYEVSQP